MNKEELKKSILEGNSRKIEDFYRFEESKKKRIQIVDTLIKFLSDKNDQLRAEVISFFGEFILGAPDISEVYGRIMLQKEKVLKTIFELLNHFNPKIRESVLSSIVGFEDGDGNVYFLEQCASRIFELLSDQSLAVQKEAGLSIFVLLNAMKMKEKYQKYLEILSLLHQNETIFSYVVSYGRFKEMHLPILQKIIEGNDKTLSEGATRMLDNILRVKGNIIFSKKSEINKMEEKVNIGKELITDIVIEISGETPKGNKKALKLLNKYLDMKEVLTTGDIAAAHYFKGEVYLRQNNLQEAKRELEMAINTDPTFDHEEVMMVSAWHMLAEISERLGKYSEAIDCHQKAIDNLLIIVDPKQTKRFIASTYLQFALFFLRNKGIENSYREKGRKYVALSYESDPEFPDCNYYLGAFYSDERDSQKAIDHLEQYLKLVSHDDPRNRRPIEVAQRILAENLRKV